MSNPKNKDIVYFEEEHDHEKNFHDYYTRNILSYYETLNEDQYKTQLKIATNLRNGLIFTISIMIIALLVMLGPLEEIYNAVLHSYEKFLKLYHNFYLALPKYISFILPSQLVYWSFPHPLTLLFLTILITFLSVLIPLLRFYSKYSDNDIFKRVVKYFGEANYDEKVDIEVNEIYDAFLLPKHDKISSEIALKTSYKDNNIAIYDLLMLQYAKNSKYKVNEFIQSKNSIAFSNLLMTVDLNVDISERMFVTNPGNFEFGLNEDMREIKIEDQNIAKEIAFITKMPPTEDQKQLEENKKLINIICKYSNVISEYNGRKDYYFDDKFFLTLKKKDYFYFVRKSIEITVKNSKLYILIPTNHYPIFAEQSIFSDNRIHVSDMHIVLAALKMVHEIIDIKDNLSTKK